ncbi:MAG: hypothetical protein ACKON7_04530, partial [Planctomycetaceae bacterium]
QVHHLELLLALRHRHASDRGAAPPLRPSRQTVPGRRATRQPPDSRPLVPSNRRQTRVSRTVSRCYAPPNSACSRRDAVPSSTTRRAARSMASRIDSSVRVLPADVSSSDGLRWATAGPVIGGNGPRLPVVTTAGPDGGPAVARDRARFIEQAFAVAISLFTHAIALIMLIMLQRSEPGFIEPRFITSSAPDIVEAFTEDHLLGRDETIHVVGLAAPMGDAVAEDTPSIAGVDGDGTVPLTVEHGAVGPETTPIDILSRIDVASGFGSRANAAVIAAREGGGADTETAVDKALAWLGEHQLDDGSWSFDLADCPTCRGACRHSGTAALGHDRVSATALALLPFLGRGNTHTNGSHRQAVDRGVSFLVATAVRSKGVMYGPETAHGLYVQGLAGIALSECYGMTRDQRLERPTQLVINHIMAAQDPRGGGWRYRPGQGGDTSVLGWQIMALKSAHLASLQVHPRTITGAVRFLDTVQADSGATYGYIDRSDQKPGRSAIGLLCRMHTGWRRDNPALRDGVARLAMNGPSDDLYYDYYATQVMHHMQGDVWKAWNAKMKSLLLGDASDRGSRSGQLVRGRRWRVRGRVHISGQGRRPPLLHVAGDDDPRGLLPPPPDLPHRERGRRVPGIAGWESGRAAGPSIKRWRRF